ncbi:hypothetical protein Tdes44962_MAKER07437 [Teratosphaeria destructans]|uniref:Uncharacterized protein n=1 Tax=Teratosphaeria destructans TaxID=418781 RepID=A0A9W7W688_9PEZI|nr:hypothetical protein Tdes44962_MAKER07437 [Teratosphaeria destructans]
MSTPPLITNETRHALWQPVEVVHLIDKMCAEIVNRPIRRRIPSFPVISGRIWPMPVEVRLEFHHVPQRAFVQDLAQGEVVGVPSSVLVDGQKLAGLLRNVRQLVG